MGLRIIKIANRTSSLAKLFADELKKAGFKILSDHFFDTVTILQKIKLKKFIKKLKEKELT